ncbi:conserved protein of unknown function; putative coiled-coil domain [Modestobacter italicus]|uniref:Uncharacterized protein n=1 Tax=Modestobacter italicus (strain DSM 44449 / CECT 9708 / BC 501) TaxID=2732864 RepID=I4EZU4_MODI5|nr:hypothetical protein [Modestobacter marinus]CCH88907.1 conserved protein of unknown function; putative coiled-coil domain [Modestobacter marinus]
MSEGARPLWPERYLTGGRLVIGPGPRPVPPRETALDRATAVVARLDWLARCGRAWRRADRTERTLACVLAVGLTGGLALLVPLAGVAVVRYREEQVRTELRRPVTPPEVTLAAWDTIEARVAGAASRAWAETLREPSWHSPFLAATRAAFDGEAEVGQVVALADRIRQARAGLGPRPAGPAAEFWDRQQAALDDAARRLGRRADALIRHRDQAAALSTELQHLADLERLERSAAEVDVLTVETAAGPGRRDAGLGDVAEDIASVRHAMTDLVDLMTRTRAPLALPPEPPG